MACCKVILVLLRVHLGLSRGIYFSFDSMDPSVKPSDIIFDKRLCLLRHGDFLFGFLYYPRFLQSGKIIARRSIVKGLAHDRLGVRGVIHLFLSLSQVFLSPRAPLDLQTGLADPPQVPAASFEVFFVRCEYTLVALL